MKFTLRFTPQLWAPGHRTIAWSSNVRLCTTKHAFKKAQVCGMFSCCFLCHSNLFGWASTDFSNRRPLAFTV